MFKITILRTANMLFYSYEVQENKKGGYDSEEKMYGLDA